jgi:hypothetical protein
MGDGADEALDHALDEWLITEDCEPFALSNFVNEGLFTSSKESATLPDAGPKRRTKSKSKSHRVSMNPKSASR